ncbi:hypothetical protein CBER1_10281 [Cercospora berteroae]|uniref:AB hydrolase-1 domain-containing protein n=1 Tax=Cercospora berteroae TaxID=357750 RepID=A0A2S6CN91_9PEZI|nr:hypothetical protein CBER1_10281 [Cercospora berteroae]
MGISCDSWPARKQVYLDVDEVLPHSSINPQAKVTVVLIHGACVDRNDWDMVIPYLHDYHLLVPDQICHGEARHIQPYTTAYAAKTIAQLIQRQGHDGRAHVVGHSLGASVALRLAAEYPEVVASLVVSGVGRLLRNRLTPYLPYAVWLTQRMEQSMPRSVIRWLMDGTDVRFGDISICTLDFNKEVFSGSLSEGAWPQFETRALVIAATKMGILPTNDNVQVARDVAETGRKLNGATFAVQHEAMRHPWNRQDPRLFAETIKAWVEQKGVLPSGIERL